MQLEITGFLEGKAKSFMEEFWGLLVDAQNQPSGIPSLFIEKKKSEIIKKQSKFSDAKPSSAISTDGKEGKGSSSSLNSSSGTKRKFDDGAKV